MLKKVSQCFPIHTGKHPMINKVGEFGSMRSPSYQCISCLFGQHQWNSLISQSMFFFMIKVQQNLSGIYPFLFSLCPIVFTYFENRQVVFPHFWCNLTGPPNLLHCPDIPYTHINCCCLLAWSSASWLPKNISLHFWVSWFLGMKILQLGRQCLNGLIF